MNFGYMSEYYHFFNTFISIPSTKCSSAAVKLFVEGFKVKVSIPGLKFSTCILQTVSLLLIHRSVPVNVDDAVDDMFRQIRGVSDDISGALRLATSGIRQRFPLGSGDVGQAVATSSAQINRTLTSESSTSQLPGPLATLVIPDNDFGEKLLSNSMLEEEYEGNYGAYTEDTAQRIGSVEWHSDSETAGDSREANTLKAAAHAFAASQSDMKDNRWFGRRLEKALSDGHSPVDSFASDMIEDELVIPQEVYNFKGQVQIF